MNDSINTGIALHTALNKSEWEPVPSSASEATPEHIGRYRVEGVLGTGAFGIVYLAHDEQLQRLVAIKMPHRQRVSRPEDAQPYLAEARTVAGLDHPNIVPVYDVGGTEQYPVFIVSKFIEGTTLAQRIRDNRPSLRETVELAARVAETLHYAHGKGLVHRDIKPGNILLDDSGKPFVADFGLALRDKDVGTGPHFAGTLPYMSPEQARGEGHRVDGRSDIFGLGVVLYELLTGRRPFHGDSGIELMEQIAHKEVRPPRQWDETIPKELERICLKALSKRASDRYSTGKNMADDLLHFLEQAAPEEKQSLHAESPIAVNPSPSPAPLSDPSSLPTLISDYYPLRIVPKGLRSFDAQDADFFLALLPGPRDREGLPDSIRYWKTRTEETDSDSTFSVGLIYGPSGCGKSSLVKAGLLPRLSGNILIVYVEAAEGETETRLLNGLRKKCPALPANLGLKETLASLRLGQGIAPGKKVLIVLDQFEQWLHAKTLTPTSLPLGEGGTIVSPFPLGERGRGEGELVQALRQCDGSRVQCIVLVRDDFWLAVSRFMRELEIDLVPGRNIALVDLFDLDHAKKVLAAFGRAFGKLPESTREISKDQRDFVTQAVSGLSQENKVICVRLALFAEMMKGRPWDPATLKEVGGTDGVGVAFLEDMFSSPTANPHYRLHQKAARAVLKALLPEAGADIKGHMRSHDELLAASGYARHARDFEELLRILDSEIRLLTPTDPEGKEGNSSATVPSGEKFYQLTHDYLVPSLRDWLTRKQKETRRGRAELLLTEQAAVWNGRPENRQLPSLLQWLRIRFLTQKKNWTKPQHRMMRKAARYHAVRGVFGVVVLTAATVLGLLIREHVHEQRQATHAEGLVQALLNANTTQVPAIVAQMADYRSWTDPLLRQEQEKAGARSRQKLHASLALLPVDAGQVEYLYGRLLDAEPGEVPVIRDALSPHKDELLTRLWAVALTPEKGKVAQRLRAAAALAKYDPQSERWGKVGALVVDDLVLENPFFLGQWSEAFHPVKDHFLPRLAEVFRDHQPERTAERNLAMNILIDYAADQPQWLAELLMDADAKQFAMIYPKFKEQGEAGLPLFSGEIDKRLPYDLPSSHDSRERLAKRQANAAVALLRLGQSEKAWPLLQHNPDPRVRSYLIHCLGPLGAEAGTILKRLDDEPDITIRRALILSLGEYSAKELTPEARKASQSKLQDMYCSDSDPGLHASAEWLLRTWGQQTWLNQINDEWAKDKSGRDKRLENIRQLLQKGKEKSPPQWFVSSRGHTMVVIPGPMEFVMGSPHTEGGREDDERQHKVRIGRTFALSAHSVTLEQYRQFDKGLQLPSVLIRMADLPVVGVSFHQAAAYCNWLSKEEGVDPDQWCYDIQNGQVTKLRTNYLSLTGYRLPTEAEMEYAIRAGTVTSRYFGETDEILPKYAWYGKNAQEKSWPVGSLKPNDLGFFDMLGNVYTWCQDRYKSYPQAQSEKPIQDEEDGYSLLEKDPRVLRGGTFYNPLAREIKSAFRTRHVPSLRDDSVGFRVARTFR